MAQNDEFQSASDDELSAGTLPGIVLAVIVAQVGLFVFLTVQYDAETVPAVLSVLVPLSSGVAGVLLGYDATLVRNSESWWHPRPWVWAFAMIPPGLNLGFCVGYLLRHREAARRTVPGDRWLSVLVPALLLAHAGNAAVTVFGDVTGGLFVMVLLVWLCASGAFGLSLVAIYYDLSFVNAVLGTVEERWPLKGYHWILLVLLLAPLLLFYYLRRRMLLSVIDEDPTPLLASAWGVVDGDGE